MVFAGMNLPAILPPNPELHSMLWNAHRFLAFCFFALILLHLAAALFHALIRRDGVYEAMAPFPAHPPVKGDASAVRDGLFGQQPDIALSGQRDNLKIIGIAAY